MNHAPRSSLVGRRTVCSRLLAAALLPALAACTKKKEELRCDDTIGMNPDDANARKLLVYVDKSPEPAKSCANCALYKPGAPDACGGCAALKGPINPAGYCKSWAAKPA
ncbi:MAG: high-potential iron-sulfur protein [Polyangiaceae bacterium]